MNIIGKRKIYYIISIILIFAGVLAVLMWGLKFGIDFKGGAMLEIAYPDGKRPEIKQITESLILLNLNDLRVSPVGQNNISLRFRETDENTHQAIMRILAANGAEERRFSSIGPTIGAELKQNSIKAIILVLLGISLYIAWAFRNVSQPLGSWRYGAVTLAALFHDLIIPIGLFAYLGHFYGVEIGTNFIVALLVILGFSVHDTIVVFDRVRENLKLHSSLEFTALVNKSVNQTIVRSVNTSLTVLLTLLALYIFGGESLQYFILTLLVGIFFGTYSSIFIASPLLASWFLKRKS